jgi:hypothetical protein
VELDWLMMCYAAARVDTKPLVILYGAETPELSAPTLPTNIRAIRQEHRNQSVNHCCESGMFITDPYFSISNLGSRGIKKPTNHFSIFNPKHCF